MEQVLKQILTTLGSMQDDIKEIKTDVAELKADVAELKADVAELKADVAKLKTDVSGLQMDMVSVKASLNRIETSQTEDVVAILKRIDQRTGERDYENLALNKRVFRLEGEVERLKERDHSAV
ncbi:MAG: hypothetical protein P0Y55_15330 [Candidatus Cohnella colombiensis]|uniref:Uncharacterized protein n=1 Tax=Candidatus Cohnella colombiensis TaxID=3121368 RepID=A0AA95JA32_9BACL|nr:MAG: hypothetical protein P0Y55_15330 [Cohnella sp.]